MNYYDQAMAAIENAEKQLNDLIKRAVADRHYDQIAILAELAKTVSALRQETTDGGALEPQRASQSDAAEAASLTLGLGTVSTASSSTFADSRSPSKSRSAHAVFPRFERDSERLVKLGWSSKDKRVYEHRVAHDAVLEICQQFSKKAASKKAFKMEKLFPMQLENGNEIPTYQAYLVLKWLQQHGVIERRGKDGYVFVDRNFDVDSISALWEKTPVRA